MSSFSNINSVLSIYIYQYTEVFQCDMSTFIYTNSLTNRSASWVLHVGLCGNGGGKPCSLTCKTQLVHHPFPNLMLPEPPRWRKVILAALIKVARVVP